MENTIESAKALLLSKGFKGIANHTSLADNMVEYTAPFQAEIDQLNESLTVMLRKNTELESELTESNRTISNLRRRLADCQRKGLTGDRI
jgi:septal ring factor EnvC (AmiA/AmiB activator)